MSVGSWSSASNTVGWVGLIWAHDILKFQLEPNSWLLHLHMTVSMAKCNSLQLPTSLRCMLHPQLCTRTENSALLPHSMSQSYQNTILHTVRMMISFKTGSIKS